MPVDQTFQSAQTTLATVNLEGPALYINHDLNGSGLFDLRAYDGSGRG